MSSVINGPLYYEGSFLMGNNLPLTDRYQIMTKASNALYCDGNVMITSNGSVAINFDAVSGNVAIGKTSAAYKFDVHGDINFTGNLYQNGSLFSDGNGGLSQWTTSGSNIYYNTGNVGVGTSSPVEKLHISGNAVVSGTLSTTSMVGSLLTASQPNVTTVGTLTSLSVAGTMSVATIIASNISGLTQVSTATMFVGSSLFVGGNMITNNHLSSAGNGTFVGILSVGGTSRLTGATVVGSSLSVSGLMVIGSTLSVSGVSYFSSNVGIGTSSPNFPLEVIGTATYSHSNYVGAPVAYGTGNFWVADSGGQDAITGIITTSYPTSVRTNGRYVGTGFVAYSDQRIKKNIQLVNDDSALLKLRTVEPKLYNYIDYVSRGTDRVYGFIAQEVREVVPEAVSVMKDFVPNVFKPYIIDLENKILFVEPSRNGKLKIITAKNVSLTLSTAIIDETSVSYTCEQQLTEEDLLNGQVFVYGYEVEDFHTLHKDYLWTINFAATQELDRQVQTLKQENADLKQHLLSVLNRLEAAGI